MKDLTKYISVASRRTKMFYTQKLKAHGVSSGQFMYIVSICECAGQTQDELAQNLLIDKSTVAKVLLALIHLLTWTVHNDYLPLFTP